MAFNGKLIELYVIDQTGHYDEFPLKYINASSYKVTPDQRMETSATRSASGLLVRQTATHTASKIEFSTTPLNNNDVKIIQDMINSTFHTVGDQRERKLGIRYYNPSTDTYKTATVYMPDVEYEINRIDTQTNTIWYNSIRYAFIEY